MGDWRAGKRQPYNWGNGSPTSGGPTSHSYALGTGPVREAVDLILEQIVQLEEQGSGFEVGPWGEKRCAGRQLGPNTVCRLRKDSVLNHKCAPTLQEGNSQFPDLIQQRIPFIRRQSLKQHERRKCDLAA